MCVCMFGRLPSHLSRLGRLQPISSITVCQAIAHLYDKKLIFLKNILDICIKNKSIKYI